VSRSTRRNSEWGGDRWQTAALAGLACFASVFAAGFALGTVRVLFLQPIIGPTLATFCELPMMLTVSWITCGWAIRRWSVSPSTRDRLIMGLTALAMLLLAEALLGTYGFGRSPAQQMQALLTPAGLLGLVAQIAFAGVPLLRR
jgi:hypothetical protein